MTKRSDPITARSRPGRRSRLTARTRATPRTREAPRTGAAIRTRAAPWTRPVPRWAAAAAALALLALLAGCGAGDSGARTDPVPAGPSTAAAPPAAATAPALPWPTSGGLSAEALQQQVDRGAQPWLLDRTEVALSFVADAYGWTTAQAYPQADGTTVDVAAPGDMVAALTLAQPGRTGPTGIWVVTVARRG